MIIPHVTDIYIYTTFTYTIMVPDHGIYTYIILLVIYIISHDYPNISTSYPYSYDKKNGQLP